MNKQIIKRNWYCSRNHKILGHEILVEKVFLCMSATVPFHQVVNHTCSRHVVLAQITWRCGEDHLIHLFTYSREVLNQHLWEQNCYLPCVHSSHEASSSCIVRGPIQNVWNGLCLLSLCLVYSLGIQVLQNLSSYSCVLHGPDTSGNH